MRIVLVIAATLALMLESANARAQDAAPPPARAPVSLYGDAHMGVYAIEHTSYGGGIDVGATLLARAWALEAGTILDYGTGWFGPGRVVVGGLVGVGRHGDALLGGDLLLEGGMHLYDTIACGANLSEFCIFGTSTRVSGHVGYLGVRTGFTFDARHDEGLPVVPLFGVWLHANWDTSTDLHELPGSGGERVALGGAFEFGATIRVGLDWRPLRGERRRP